MKSKFSLYYRLSDKEKEELFERENCYFVFDTNALLDIYRFGKDTAGKILSLIKEKKDRIVIPFHVAEEYHQRMMDIITELYSSYNTFQKNNNGESILELFSENLNLNKYPPIKRKFQKHIGKALDAFFEDIASEESYIKEQYNTWNLQNEISELLKGKILDSFTDDDIGEIKKEGSSRYNDKIPPGYKDSSKSPKTENIYGDLIIWKEILRFSKEKNCSIIFITRDLKEDWVQKTHGIVCGPRLELLKEFKEISAGTFYIYTLDQFITFANKQSKVLGEPEISEMKDVVVLYANMNESSVEDKNSIVQREENVVFSEDKIKVEKSSVAANKNNSAKLLVQNKDSN